MKTLAIRTQTLIIAGCLVFILAASLVAPEQGEILNEDMRLVKLLESLGDDALDHYPDTDIFGVSAKRGEAIVKEGFSSRPGGGRTRRQSKHFVCTSCHNLQREDPDLSVADPQARLEYTQAQGMPFLQATSLYGVVNRESYYNDDYYKKYGDLVIPARNDIRGAIQLCAVECAQGRKLLPWELESILAYLWTIDLKLSDLVLSDEEFKFIEKAFSQNLEQDSAVNLIRSRYLTYSPAHFTTAHSSLTTSDSLAGHPENGKLIYEGSCLHCHENRRYSFFHLDNSSLCFQHLANKADGYGRHSIYQVVRYGVYSRSGKRSYMPQYPLEKMSEQQLADLDAYIQMRASEG